MSLLSTEIWLVINRIANEPSKNKKLEIIKEYIHDDHFRKVLEYAYNPFKRYGIDAIGPRTTVPSTDGEFFHIDDLTWQLLDDLISRKLTGGAAKKAVEDHIDYLGPQSSELFRRILKKDLRAGFSESTINKAAKGLIPVYPYMRCSLPSGVDLDKFAWQAGVFSQEKADGMFANISYTSDGPSITSRQGSPFPSDPFQSLLDEFMERMPSGFQYHGELLVKRDGLVLPREQSNGVLNSVLKGGQFASNEIPIYHVWDMIPLSAVVAKGKHNEFYNSRLARLASSLKNTSGGQISLIPTRIVYSFEAATDHYSELLAKGKEGTIIKDPQAIWKDGTSKQQVKFKLEVDVDLMVLAFLPGEGKNASTFGSILVTTSDGHLEVAVSGFTDAHRAEIWSDQSMYYGKIMTVKANQIMKPSAPGGKWSLFLPRFVEFRSDKVYADSIRMVIDQFDSAIKPVKQAA